MSTIRQVCAELGPLKQDKFFVTTHGSFIKLSKMTLRGLLKSNIFVVFFKWSTHSELHKFDVLFDPKKVCSKTFCTWRFRFCLNQRWHSQGIYKNPMYIYVVSTKVKASTRKTTSPFFWTHFEIVEHVKVLKNTTHAHFVFFENVEMLTCLKSLKCWSCDLFCCWKSKQR